MPNIRQYSEPSKERRVEAGCLFKTHEGKHFLVFEKEGNLGLLDLETSTIYRDDFNHVNHLLNHMMKHYNYHVLYEDDYEIVLL